MNSFIDRIFHPENAKGGMYPLVALWLGRVTNACVYLAVVLVPLFFLPLTVDVIELNKQALLIILATIGLLAWLAKGMAERRLSLSRSWIHLVVLVFLGGYAVASAMSLDRYLSFIGNFGQMQWAFISLAAFVAFYFILANTMDTTAKMYHVLLAYLGSSCVVGLVGLLQVMGVYPFGWMGSFASVMTFNTVGTVNSFAVYMTTPLILAASLTVLGCKDATCVLGQEGKKSMWAKVLVWVTMAIALAVAVIVDYWVVWTALLFGMALLVIIPLIRTRKIKRQIEIIVPVVLVVVSFGLLLFRTPIHLPIPAEVSPSMKASWSIARQTIQEHPLFGSGPGTWIYDYSKFRSPSVNTSQFWTTRFDRGLSTVLTLLAMSGIIGAALWLILLLSGVIKSATHLVTERNDDAWQAYLTVFTGWATIAFVGFIYNYNVSHHFVFWFLFGLLAARVARGRIVWDARRSTLSSALFSVMFLLACVGAVSALWMVGQRWVAEQQFSKAVILYRDGKPIKDSISALNTSISLNGANDSAYRNLSQAYLVLASQDFQGKPDADRMKQVNADVTSAVDAAKRATEISPANVDNWSNFASILQSITSFTRGADDQAIAMYQEAAKREPNNPVFMNEIGKIYIMRADAYRQLLQSKSDTVKKDAQSKMDIELGKAADALNQSIQMKPDFAAAHYDLALVYERQGRLNDAITKMQEVLKTNSKDVGVAFQLAILYYRNNEKDKAQYVFEQIVAFDPSYSNARWYLASIYQEQGKYDDAIAQIRKVLELNPGNATVQQQLDALTKLRDAKAKPAGATLPDPVKENVTSPSAQNSLKK